MTKYINSFVYLQYNFSLELSQKIFKNDGRHLYDKWLTCGGNFLDFCNMLDFNNKIILSVWINAL